MGRNTFAAVALVAPLALTGLIVAAPASAGCESQVFATYCDGPIKPDGTWVRCFQTTGETNVFGGVISPSVGRCFPYDPSNPPLTPLGQPGDHVYP